MQEAIKRHNFYRKLWQERKVVCMDLIENIADGSGKKVKDIMAEVGLETDEDCSNSLPPLIKETR